jgi:hypothetical protein
MGGGGVPLSMDSSGTDITLALRVDELVATQRTMAHYLQGMAHKYEAVVSDMLTCRQHLVAQDQMIRNLLQYMSSNEASMAALGGASTAAPSLLGSPPPVAHHLTVDAATDTGAGTLGPWLRGPGNDTMRRLLIRRVRGRRAGQWPAARPRP